MAESATQRSAASVAPEPLIDYLNLHPSRQDIVQEVLAGMKASQKTLSPKYFYDETGSRLFEEITRQPEYYPTRTERQILQDNALDIAKHIGDNTTIIEPGCGSCEKIRLILDATRPSRYIAMDISDQFLLDSANLLAKSYPWLNISAVCADFSQLSELSPHLEAGKRVAFYPGSTLGNFNPPAAQKFLQSINGLVGKGGGLLIGVDRHKDGPTLHAAYNDESGVTAAFNLNALSHLNKVLPANFNEASFEHLAYYNTEEQRIEMHLTSRKDQQVSCADHRIDFKKGETIHSESSYKYTKERFQDLAERSGFSIQACWTDEQELFSVYYCTVS